MAELGRADGWVNLARVYQREGRIPDALAALEKAANHKEPGAPWVINWLTGQINASNGLLDEAIASFESVLATKIPDRKFDFSTDYRVINDLGAALYARARIELPVTSPARRDYLQKAIAAYRRTLAIDSEDVSAHWGLAQAYSDPAWGSKTAGAPPPASRPDAGDAERRAGRRRRAREAGRPRSPIPRSAATERRSRALTPGTRRSIGSWTARGRAISRGWSRFTRSSTILGPAWDAAVTDPDTLAALAQALKVSAQTVARTAQARRDRRGPGVFAGAQTRPRGQPQRPVDRDPSAAPPRAHRESISRHDGRRDTIHRTTTATAARPPLRSTTNDPRPRRSFHRNP